MTKLAVYFDQFTEVGIPIAGVITSPPSHKVNLVVVLTLSFYSYLPYYSYQCAGLFQKDSKALNFFNLFNTLSVSFLSMLMIADISDLCNSRPCKLHCFGSVCLPPCE